MPAQKVMLEELAAGRSGAGNGALQRNRGQWQVRETVRCKEEEKVGMRLQAE